jgi:hypothetical protein
MTTVLNAQNAIVAEIRLRESWVLAIPVRIDTALDAWRFQRAIESALKAGNRRRVLVDARMTVPSSREVNALMWKWSVASLHFDALAILNQSSVLTVAARMQALALGTRKIGVFDEPSAATAWLLAQPQRNAVSEIRRVVSSKSGRIHIPPSSSSKRQR